jgi:small-conductance mechanosensitive channel
MRYSTVLLIFILYFPAIKILRSVILKQAILLEKHIKISVEKQIHEIFDNISSLFVRFTAFYIPLRTLFLNDIFEKVLDGIFLILVTLEAVKIIRRFLHVVLQNLGTHREKTAINGLQLISKIILWIAAFLFVLSGLGFNISALVASLGIGGLAIAFAAQNVLADIFASFTIYFDKPFQVGDYIIVTGSVGVSDGIVAHIGLKTTRIVSLRGEEVVVSNKELTESHIQNFKKLEKRRVDFKIGVTYDTSSKKLKKIPSIIEKIVKEVPLTEYGWTHFHEFADFNLSIKIMYYVTNGNYRDYLDTQQSINFKIKEAFEEEGIEMAFPTQTVYVKK